jgi:hypothetical protein
LFKVRNIEYDNILVFVDQPSGKEFVSAHGFPEAINIYQTCDVFPVLNSKAIEKIVIIVTGHGNQNGIAATVDIRPYELIRVIKSINKLKCGLIVLGQCYAGTFNYLEARSQDPITKKNVSPEICIVGATDLHVSISSLVNISTISPLNTFECNTEWLANLFLFWFMYYIAIPQDTDGDGMITVVDTYKAAGIGANELLIFSKQNAFLAMHDLLLQQGGTHPSSTPIVQRMTQEAHADYIAKSAIVLSSQTPWILHANFARQIKL